MSKSIVVLGAGMVGSAMACDLVDRFDVTAVDRDVSPLAGVRERDSRITTVQLDLSRSGDLRELLTPFNLVVNAVPGFMGFETLATVLRAEKNVVDISFFPEDALTLSVLAKEKGVTAIVDCGVAPGMDNFILGYWDSVMEIDRFECLVGGLPKSRKWPFEYKAPFSPVDVIAEYTRPARYIENGRLVTRPALSDPEFVEFDGVGTLESFNTDGLRSIVHTMPHIPNMKEKTLRFPGHIEYVRVLQSTGFFEVEPLDIGGTPVRPIDVTSRLLFDEWKLGETESEFTVMRVTIEGKKNGQPTKVVYHLYDEYDAETRTSSMARTTGYTATAAATMLMEGVFAETGVFPPELVGKNAECFRFVTDYLSERGVVYRMEES